MIQNGLSNEKPQIYECDDEDADGPEFFPESFPLSLPYFIPNYLFAFSDSLYWLPRNQIRDFMVQICFLRNLLDSLQLKMQNFEVLPLVTSFVIEVSLLVPDSFFDILYKLVKIVS